MPEKDIVWPKSNWEVLQLAGRVLPGVIANVALGLVFGKAMMHCCGPLELKRGDVPCGKGDYAETTDAAQANEMGSVEMITGTRQW